MKSQVVRLLATSAFGLTTGLAGTAILNFNDLQKPIGSAPAAGSTLQSCIAGGSGFGSGWIFNDNTAAIVTEAADLVCSVPHYVPAQPAGFGPNSIGFVRDARTRKAILRNYVTPIGSTTRPVYVSFLVKLVGNNAECALVLDSAGLSGDSQANGRKGIHIGDDGAPGDIGIFNTPGNQLADLPLGTSNANGTRADLSLNDENAHLVVAKIEFGATDTVTLWVDPDVADEAALLAMTPTLKYQGFDIFPANQFSNIGLEIVRDPSANTSFDNVRVSDAPNAFDVIYKGAQSLISIADYGKVLNVNPTFDVDRSGWNATTGGDGVTPGILGTLGSGVRVEGKGDPGGKSPDHFGQDLPQGASDFELTSWMTPLAKSQFAAYTAVVSEPPATDEPGFDPAGQNGDRTFQMIIMGNNGTVPLDNGFTTVERGKFLINLAYFPAGITANGTEGFYVRDGVAGWILLPELGTIAGSVDANNNGILDAGTGDTVLPYQVRVKGTGFSTSSASFRVSLFDPRTQVTKTSAALTYFGPLDLRTTTPSAVVFTTGDTGSFGGGLQSVASTFWIDDTAFFAGSSPAIRLTTVGSKTELLAANTTTGSGVIHLRNDGNSSPLTISAASFDNGLFTLTTPPPFTINPGIAFDLPVSFDANGLTVSNSTSSKLTLTTNDPAAASKIYPVFGGKAVAASQLPNGDFETLGTDPTGFSDSFAFWFEDGIPTFVVPAPGIVAGSAISAYLKPGSAALRQRAYQEIYNAVVDFRFAFKAADANTRQISLQLFNDDTGFGEILNIRYQDGRFWAYSPEPNGSWNEILAYPLTPSVDTNGDGDFLDAGESVVPYRLVIYLSNLGTADASFTLNVFDADGSTLLGSSGPRSNFRNPNAFAGRGFQTTFFTSQYGGVPGWWVDNLTVSAATAGSGVTITNFAKAGNSFLLQWNSNGAAVSVERSITLDSESWETLSNGNVSGTFTDNSLPAGGKAFYRVRKE